MSAPLLTNHDLLLAQNVQPKGVTPGVTQDAGPASAGGGAAASPLAGFTPILMMLVVIVPFWLMMSRRQKKESQARSALKRGDRVTTTGGLIGELVEMDDRVARVKISPGTTVEIVASTVTPYAEAERAPTKGLKEVKALPDKK